MPRAPWQRSGHDPAAPARDSSAAHGQPDDEGRALFRSAALARRPRRRAARRGAGRSTARARGRRARACSRRPPAGTCRTRSAGTPGRCRCRCRRPPARRRRRRRVERDGHRAAGRRELDGVRQQVPDHLLEPIADRRTVGSAGDSNRRSIATPRASAAGRIESTARSSMSVTRSTALISSRSLPVAIRETSSRSSTSRVWTCALRSTFSSARSLPDGGTAFAAQQLRPAEDRVERRAQLVRQRREELVLQPVRFALAHEQLGALLLGAPALGDFVAQLLVGGRQLLLPQLDPLEHAVEGVDQHAEFVVGRRARRGASNRRARTPRRPCRASARPAPTRAPAAAPTCSSATPRVTSSMSATMITCSRRRAADLRESLRR